MSTLNVSIGTWNSLTDANMIISNYSISTPERKTHYVSIPGRNGDIDLTDFCGEAYEMRTIEINLYKECAISDFETEKKAFMSSLSNKGQILIGFSNFTDGLYYKGRVKVEEISMQGLNVLFMKLSANIEPYKYNSSSVVQMGVF